LWRIGAKITEIFGERKKIANRSLKRQYGRACVCLCVCVSVCVYVRKIERYREKNIYIKRETIRWGQRGND
jgi:hypothetical protein